MFSFDIVEQTGTKGDDDPATDIFVGALKASAFNQYQGTGFPGNFN